MLFGVIELLMGSRSWLICRVLSASVVVINLVNGSNFLLSDSIDDVLCSQLFNPFLGVLLVEKFADSLKTTRITLGKGHSKACISKVKIAQKEIIYYMTITSVAKFDKI